MEGSPGSYDAAATAQRLDVAIRRLRGRLRTESGLHSTGLTISQISVLVSVVDNGPIAAAQLAALEHVTPQAIAQSLAALKAAGLVYGRPDPGDRRKVLISADPSAKDLIDAQLTRRTAFLAGAIDRYVAPGEQPALEKAIELIERLASAGLNAEPM